MTRDTKMIEVITRDQCRRRRSAAEKVLVCKTYERGMSVSPVGREEGVSQACCSLGASSIANARW